MSDEQSPPPLRLRPRKRDDEAAPAVAPTISPPVPSPVVTAVPPRPPMPPVIDLVPTAAPAADAAPLRFRLKPKLSSEPEVKAVVAAPLPMPSLPPAVPDSAAVHAPDAAITPSEIPRLKLKSLGAQETAGAAPFPAPIQATPPPIPTGGAPFPALPAFPVVQTLPPMPVTAPSDSELLIGGLPPVTVAPAGLPLPPPRVMPPPMAPPPPPVVAASPYKSKSKAKTGRPPVVLFAVAAAVALTLAGGAAYFFLMKEESVSAGETVKPDTKPDVGAAAIPKPPAVVIGPLPPPPSPLQPVTTTPTSSTPLVPVATPKFRAWVLDVRVSGVRSGSSTSAILNGRVARPGDMVDAAEGIVLESVDVEQKILTFRGRNGAVLTKPY